MSLWFYHFLLHVFCISVIRPVHILDYYIFLINWFTIKNSSLAFIKVIVLKLSFSNISRVTSDFLYRVLVCYSIFLLLLPYLFLYKVYIYIYIYMFILYINIDIFRCRYGYRYRKHIFGSNIYPVWQSLPQIRVLRILKLIVTIHMYCLNLPPCYLFCIYTFCSLCLPPFCAFFKIGYALWSYLYCLLISTVFFRLALQCISTSFTYHSLPSNIITSQIMYKPYSSILLNACWIICVHCKLLYFYMNCKPYSSNFALNRKFKLKH